MDVCHSLCHRFFYIKKTMPIPANEKHLSIIWHFMFSFGYALVPENEIHKSNLSPTM